MNKANYVNPLFAEMLKAVPEEARRESLSRLLDE